MAKAAQFALRRHGLLLAASLIPFTVSIVYSIAGSVEQTVLNETERPALVFDEYFADFGSYPIQPRPVVYARFTFRNRGTEAVHVTNLEPSCGCLAPILDARIIAPDESGEVILRVQTANQEPGPQEYTLKVYYTDPKPRELDLGLKLVLPDEQVVIRPRALLVQQLGTAETTHTATITDYRSRKFNVTNVVVASDLAEAELGRVEDAPDGTRRFRIDVRVAGHVPPGRHRAVVNVQTDDAGHPLVQLPLLIEGPRDAGESSRAIHSDPATLRLTGTAGEQFAGEVLLNSHHMISEETVRIDTVPEFVSATLVRVDVEGSSGWHGLLSVKVASDRPAGPFRGIVRLRSSEAGPPLLELPVVVEPAE